MQPIKMTIYGKFWDSQIYSGHLYLFGMNGEIKTLSWNKLFDVFRVDCSLQIALEAAFKKSSLLYSEDNQILMSDIEIKSVIRNKFDRLMSSSLIASDSQIAQCVVGTQDNIFSFPHTDTEIYNKKIYVASRNGVSSASCLSKTKYPISTKLEKHWDAPSLRVAASYGNIAIAAGSEGLYEKEVIGLGSWEKAKDPQQISNIHCSDCDWNYYSIFGSSHVSSGFLAYQEQPKNKYKDSNIYSFNSYDDEDIDSTKFSANIVRAESIFGQGKYSWGSKDKICQVSEEGINVYRFNPWEDEKYIHMGLIRFNEWKGGFVSAKLSSFGTIIELDNALVVLRSDNEITTIAGEPVNWRVFPRSKFYENQLHVIFDDRLEIYSFNHDYFVNQNDKMSGYKMRIV